MPGDTSKNPRMEKPPRRVDHVDDADKPFGDHDVIFGGCEYPVPDPVQCSTLRSLGDAASPVSGWRPVGGPDGRNDLGERSVEGLGVVEAVHGEVCA